MLAAVARAVHPPDRPRGLLARQRVQHREHGGGADPGADQHDRPGPVAQDEAAAGGGGVDQVADLHVLVQEAACGPFALDADPIAALVREVRERVAAGEGRAVSVRFHAYGKVLACLRARARRRAVGGHEPKRGDGLALPPDLRHAQRLEPGPRGRGRRAAVGLGEQFAEAPLPALAERRHPHRPFEQRARLGGEVEEPVDLRDRQSLGPVGDLHDRVAGLHRSLLEDSQVEAGAVVGDQQRRHGRLGHPDADAVARHARLGDLEQRLADPVAIADADLVVGEALDGEVLAELPVGEVASSQFALPVAVGLDLVDEHGAVLATVRKPVGLVVAVDVDPPHHARPSDRLLPDRGADGLALPLDLAGATDVDGQKPAAHCAGHGVGARRRWPRRTPAALSRRRSGARAATASTGASRLMPRDAAHEAITMPSGLPIT